MVFPTKRIDATIASIFLALCALLVIFQGSPWVLWSFLLPIGLTAVFHGFTGGMGAGLAGTAVLLLFASFTHTAWSDLQSMAAAFMLVGLLIGWMLSPIVLQRLERESGHHMKQLQYKLREIETKINSPAPTNSAQAPVRQTYSHSHKIK